MKMKQVGIAVLLIILIVGCQYEFWKQKGVESEITHQSPPTLMNDKEGVTDNMKLEITVEINGEVFNAILYNNTASKEFLKMLPLTINMNDMNGNEKYYYLDEGLTTESVTPKKINKGDLMLFGSDCLVLFYETFNTSFSYTSLGFIENTEELKETLGKGNAMITFYK